MKFGHFLWDNFRSSSSYKEVIEAFEYFNEDTASYDRLKHLKILTPVFHSVLFVPDNSESTIQFIDDVFKIRDLLREAVDSNSVQFDGENTAAEFLESCWDLNNDFWIQELFEMDNVAAFSTALFLICPDHYFPYLFRRQFYDLKAIFDEFGMFLPPVPPKKELDERRKYYWELCKSVRTFIEQHDIEPRESPAFLYGFAIKTIQRYSYTDSLPPPQKAYFVGGGINNNGDFEYLDKADDKTVYYWQGNPDSQPGDIVVMYCLSPRSYIHSIWRIVAPGSVDPFFFFYRTVFIGQPRLLNKTIAIDEIKTDPVLKDMPLVKGNMQGINGRVIDKKYYDRIIEILANKGQNVAQLPRLEDIALPKEELKNERDVEIHLLEPLLQELGYQNTDWKRQFKIRMGRGEKVIADYVLFPVEQKGDESGFWVWEAKFAISHHKQLKTDFDQAKSYALRLQCKGLSLISQEGVWACEKNFEFKNLKFWSWKQVRERDGFSELYDMVGKKHSRNAKSHG